MSKKINIKSFLIAGLFSLFIPLGAYFYLKLSGHDGRVQLPRTYGYDKVDSQIVDGKIRYDTTFHTLKDLHLINQLGDTISLNETLKGKILVVDFFFTTCASICPQLSHNMYLLNKAYRKNDSSVRFLSITVDPEHDSIPQLRRYADKYEANHDKWFFLTGNKKEIYDFARKELLLPVEEGNGDEEDFIHPDRFVLIDKYRNIRGYYNGLDSNEVRLCAEDIALLMLEKNVHHEKKK